MGMENPYKPRQKMTGSFNMTALSYSGNETDIESDAGECQHKNEARRDCLVAPVHFPAIQLSTTPNL